MALRMFMLAIALVLSVASVAVSADAPIGAPADRLAQGVVTATPPPPTPPPPTLPPPTAAAPTVVAPTAPAPTATTPPLPQPSIRLTGLVTAININIVTIGRFNVQFDDDDDLSAVVIGTPVRVEGSLLPLPGGIVLVRPTTYVINAPNVTTTTVSITGAVENVSVNIITLYGVNFVLDASNPSLAALQPGDFITVGGNLREDDDDTTIDVIAPDVVIISDIVVPSIARPVTLIIEGPVQTVTNNVVSIYNVNVAINPADPILTSIQVGRRLRVEADVLDDDDDGIPVEFGLPTTVNIIAVNVYIIDIDIVIGNNNVIIWQNGNCQNPPPPWAPANGWRARCEGGGGRRPGVIIRNGVPSVDGQNGGNVGAPSNPAPPPPPPPSGGGGDDDDD